MGKTCLGCLAQMSFDVRPPLPPQTSRTGRQKIYLAPGCHSRQPFGGIMLNRKSHSLPLFRGSGQRQPGQQFPFMPLFVQNKVNIKQTAGVSRVPCSLLCFIAKLSSSLQGCLLPSLALHKSGPMNNSWSPVHAGARDYGPMLLPIALEHAQLPCGCSRRRRC